MRQRIRKGMTMEISVKRFRKPATWLLLLALAATAAGCASMKAGQDEGMVVKTLWKGGDQYVAIEKQDRPAGVTVPVNDHPAEVSADRLRGALASLEVRLPGKEKAVQLFDDPELAILGEHVRKGLALAGPDEDVTFAIIGHYPTILGILKERKVTTGRVFCRDGRLNVIFGDVLRDVKEDEDRRLYPFIPGSRGKEASGPWSLAARPGGESFSMKRPDWVTFPLASPALPAAAPAVRGEIGPAGAEGEGEAPAVSPAKPATAGKGSVEERLIILNGLKDKGLITEEEYKAKRQEILNEL